MPQDLGHHVGDQRRWRWGTNDCTVGHAAYSFPEKGLGDISNHQGYAASFQQVIHNFLSYPGSISGDCVLDALHHVARIAREQNTEAAKEALELARLDHDDRFQRALQAVLSVLPTPRMVTGKDSPLSGAAADADALERVRQLLFAKEIPIAKQWEFFDKGKP